MLVYLYFVNFEENSEIGLKYLWIWLSFGLFVQQII